MTPAQAQARARELISKEINTGPAWGPVISALGYDPRQGYGKSTGLNFSARWQQGRPSAQAEAGKPEPTPGAPAAGAPAAGPPPPPPRTYDSQYTLDTGRANLTRDYGLADIGTERSRLTFDTGYNASGEIDVTNPYSQAMALQRHWQQSRSGASISMAARGQLYSGARTAALRNVDYEKNKDEAGLLEYTRRRNEDLTTAEQRVGSTWSLDTLQANVGQAGRWQDSENDWYARYGS